MFINLYSNLMINYGNNTHIITNSEDKFLNYANSYLIESITNEAAMNYRPNTKQFLIKLSDMSQANSINYIVWYTNTAYKHFKVLSCELYKEYAIYSCDNDLWADATFNNDFINSKIRLMRSNMTYSENNNAITAYYDSLNYTKGKFTDTELTMYFDDTNTQIPSPNANFRAYIVCDIEIDRKEASGFIYGISTKQMLFKVGLDSGQIDTWLDKISRIVQDSNGNKVNVRKCYFLPFNLYGGTPITVKYKTNGGALEDLSLTPMENNILPVVVYTDINSNNYNHGNNKLFVGGGYSLMEIENVLPSTRIYYRFMLNSSGIKVYVEQGNNTKDITEAYTIQVTTNDGLLTTQEATAKFISSGLKMVSGALMTAGGVASGNAQYALSGITSMINSGIDLMPSQKNANYTIEGDAVSTYIGSNWFNMRAFTAINDMSAYNGLYGVNYNYFTTISNVATGSLLIANYRPYIKGISIEMSNMSVDEYNFINSELERGIYINYIN